MNILNGKRLRYLIGTDLPGAGYSDAVTEVGYDVKKPVRFGTSIAYCNLFDEKNSGRYGPYLKPSDTAREYKEGMIDPKGSGWTRHLQDQFALRYKQGFKYIEIDNTSDYKIDDVMEAIDVAHHYDLKVIAKNPLLLGRDNSKTYVSHPNVYGIIVERDAGEPATMDLLRRKISKLDIPVWFVAFGTGHKWANDMAKTAKNYKGMGVTYSSEGEYERVVDILKPK